MSKKDAEGTQRIAAEFRLGKWQVYPDLNQIRRNGERIDLQNLSMAVLVYLAERQGQVVTYHELLENLWRGRIVGEDAVHRRIADIRRHLGDDRQNPTFIQTIPKKGYSLVAPVQSALRQSRKRWQYVAAAVSLPIAIAVIFAFVQPYATPTNQFVDAPSEAADVTTVTIESSPPSAMVYYKRYRSTDDQWQPIGMTPLETELPPETLRLRFVADGFRTVEMAAPNPSMVFNNVGRDYFVVNLPAASDTPQDMVFVPGVDTIVPLFGFYTHADLGRFLVGRTEVSNREYMEFVEAGGYESSRYWQEIDDADFEFAMVSERLVDTTGQPGPAGWIDGHYPPDTGELPVTGVSWYEATAYANYRGLSLPTARHWARAALGIDESRWPLAPALLETANISAPGPKPVIDDDAMSTWGAINMIGNVREWTTTRDGQSRLSPGLGFGSQQWGYALPGSSNPMQRAPDLGIRLVSYIDEAADPPLAMGGRVPAVPQVSASEYAKFASLFAYEPDRMAAEAAIVDYSRQEQGWIRQRVTIHSDRLPEPLPVLIFRPAALDGPVQPVIYLPPGDSYTGNFPAEDIDISRYGIEFIVESGRALVWPIIAGTHDRFRPRPKTPPNDRMQRWLKLLQVRRAEIGTVIDYLEFQPGFDGRNTGLLAASFGATFVSPSILATEDRIRSAVLMSSSLAAMDTDRFPAVVNPNTYWPRTEIPIMLLNGSHDISIHATESRDLMLRTIGTPAARKRGVLYDAPHWPLPPHRVRDDTLSWFDQYLGPVR